MTKILVDKAVIEQALEALDYERTANNPLDWHHDKTMQALRAALEQPQGEQESVAWRCFDGEGDFEYRTDEPSNETRSWSARYNREWEPLYTHSQNLNCKSNQHRLATLWGYEKPQPPRQPLTEMEIVELRQLTPGTLDVQFVKFARVLEAAHGIGE